MLLDGSICHWAIPWGLIPGCCGPVSDFIFNDLSGKSICKLVVFDIFGSQFVTIADIEHFQKWSWGDSSQYLRFPSFSVGYISAYLYHKTLKHSICVYEVLGDILSLHRMSPKEVVGSCSSSNVGPSAINLMTLYFLADFLVRCRLRYIFQTRSH